MEQVRRKFAATITVFAILVGAVYWTLRPDGAPTAPSVTIPVTPTWAIAPDATGADVPPVGRSLFDHIVMDGVNSKTYRIPFPLPALLARIERKAGCPSEPSAREERLGSPPPPGGRGGLDSCLKAVLIPLGRSLQRTTAAPDFFIYPRVVVAVDGEPETANVHLPLLKDRLYIGYQENAGLIEVISYNDAAGRFEFQLVKDYRQGRTPRVEYANRVVCTACHQNHAPIFSRPLWEETNANPAVAAQLTAQRKDFYGINVARGVDIPNAIDDATDRANLFSATQRLWRDGCDATPIARAIRCRAALLTAALQYRLSGERDYDTDSASWREDFLPVLRDNVARRWQDGLAIPSPDIPNRNPLPRAYTDAALPSGLSLAHIPARFEPLQRRAPIGVWHPEQTDFPRRAVIGVAAFLAQADVNRLKQRPAAAVSAAVDELATATVNGESDALSDKPFRRDVIVPALLARLGLGRHMVCCANDAHLPAPEIDNTRSEPESLRAIEQATPDIKRFYPYCGSCHNTHETSPPNFLYGDVTKVAANIERCAERIHFRLSMWQLAEHERPKTPMPPQLALDRLHADYSTGATSQDLRAMTAYVAGLVRAKSGSAPSAEQLALKNYEATSSCLH